MWDARMNSGVYEEIEALSGLHEIASAEKPSDSSQGTPPEV